MAHYAQIDNNNTVIQVIVAEQDFIDSGAVGNPATWIQTSYNTSGGVHRLGGTPLRMNYAGIGYTYDRDLDAFIPPRPFASWLLDTVTCSWRPPVPLPADSGTGDPPKMYMWDEETVNWAAVEPPTEPNA